MQNFIVIGRIHVKPEHGKFLSNLIEISLVERAFGPNSTHQNTYSLHTVYPKKYAHGFCFAVLCCGYTLTDFTISIKLTSLALWQSNDCPSASKATLMNMDKYFMWIHYEQLHNHNKAKHNKTVCIFLGIYCIEAHTKCLDFQTFSNSFSCVKTVIFWFKLHWNFFSRAQ